VTVDRFNVSVDQSTVTTGAQGTADISLSRCGSSGRSYTIALTATDQAGTVAWTTTDTWTPARSLPFIATKHTDALSFNTTYQVNVAVTDSGGTAVASRTISVATPTARTAACASIVSMNASGGYAPGSNTVGAIWAGYKVSNCGGASQLDMELVESDQATGIVAWRNPYSPVIAGGGTGGVGLVDNDYAPLSTTYDVVVNVRDHATGELLDSSSMVTSTPPPK
jgi:hypothetical protein